MVEIIESDESEPSEKYDYTYVSKKNLPKFHSSKEEELNDRGKYAIDHLLRIAANSYAPGRVRAEAALLLGYHWSRTASLERLLSENEKTNGQLLSDEDLRKVCRALWDIEARTP